MKAIIMAGGAGQRLRPLTCNIPKPMLPMMDIPMMQHIINLLKKHNIRDIGITLQYLPSAVSSHFGDGRHMGVRLRYYVEEQPLGTAGSVRAASDFLDSDFLVISGDCLTDIDLSAVIAFHKQKSAIATLTLSRVAQPLEYGIVVADSSGNVVRFLEKPDWSEVFSDWSNTGIYVLSPKVFNYYKEGEFFDFSKDLFPLLLKDKQNVAGYQSSGYWCDIGDSKSYMDCHFDILDRRILVDSGASAHGNEIGRGAIIEPGAVIVPPVYIGENAHIRSGARIGPYAIIGKNCKIGAASIKRSILHDSVSVGANAALRGCIVAREVTMQNYAAAYEGAIIGANSVVGADSQINSGIAVWPCKTIPEGSVVNENVVWGGKSESIFESLPVINKTATPEYAARLGLAFANAVGMGGIAVSCCSAKPLIMLKNAFVAGLLSAGAKVFDFGIINQAAMRSALPFYNLNGGVHLTIEEIDGEQILRPIFSGSGGIDLSSAQQRKLDNLFLHDDYSRTESADIQEIVRVDDYLGFYLQEIYNSCKQRLNAGVNLICSCGTQKRIAKQFLEALGIAFAENAGIRGAITAIMDSSGETLTLIDESGKKLSQQQYDALVCYMLLANKSTDTIALKADCSETLLHLCEQHNARIAQSKCSRHSYMAVMRQHHLTEQFRLHFDACYALYRVVQFLQRNNLHLSDIVKKLPAAHMHTNQIQCDTNNKGYLMRSLMQQSNLASKQAEGVRFAKQKGWALVIPHKSKPLCTIIAEGATEEYADELCSFYTKKVNEILSKTKTDDIKQAADEGG